MLAESDVETRSLAPSSRFRTSSAILGGGVKLSYANKPFPLRSSYAAERRGRNRDGWEPAELVQTLERAYG
jgi:hypothetical protein